MATHVGCCPLFREIILYDDIKKKVTKTSIKYVNSSEIEQVEEIFTQIKSKIQGKLGFVCFGLGYLDGNEIRLKIVDEGLKCGFENVEIIDYRTAQYLYAMSKISYKPLNDDVIWMHDVKRGKHIGEWNTIQSGYNGKAEKKLKLKRGVDIYLRKDVINNGERIIESNERRISFKCTFGYFYAEGSLLKARIKAGDPNFVHLEAINFLCQKMTLYIGIVKIVCYEETQQLPINFSQKIIKKSNDDVLDIVSENEIKSYKLPNCDEIVLSFKVDENGIYYINFENVGEAAANQKKFDEISTIRVGWDATAKSDTTLSYVSLEPNEIEKVEETLTKIKSKFQRELGCVCFCLSYHYGNEIRKEIIKEGFKCGFKNVEIIDYKTAEYLYAMSQIPFKPVNGNVIWLRRYDYIRAWHIIDQKAEYMGEWKTVSVKLHDLRNIAQTSKIKRGPDIFVYEAQNINVFIKSNILQLSSKCQVFRCMYLGFNEIGCSLKAKITAGDPGLAHMDAYNFLCRNITLKIGEREIIRFEENQRLPIKYTRKLEKESKDDVLDIISENEIKFHKLPQWDEINLTFNVDENGIYYLIFENLKGASDKSDDNYAIPKKDNLMKTNLQAIGIDLGTSRCCAAVNRINVVATAPLDNNGERLLPSYVAYDEEHVKCGKIVVNRLRHFSKSTIFDSKRIVGRNFDDVEIDENWSFNVTYENEKIYMEIKGFNGKRKLTAEEVAADLLRHTKQKCEEFQGTKIFNVVVTVPAAFTEQQKKATVEAAKIVGFNKIQLLLEPIAAAFAYFIDRSIQDNSNVLLFDLGGGTLDICIFKIQKNKIKVISNTGDSKLGGRNFDTVLMNYFKNLLSTKYGISISRDKKCELMLKCQSIKEDLSATPTSFLAIDDFDPSKDGIISITREEFEKITKTLLNKIKNTIQSALFKSDYKTDQIDKVLLVGGGSRMPSVKKLLKEMFSNAEHCCDQHPDEVVAIGAAYYAYHIFSDE